MGLQYPQYIHALRHTGVQNREDYIGKVRGVLASASKRDVYRADLCEKPGGGAEVRTFDTETGGEGRGGDQRGAAVPLFGMAGPWSAQGNTDLEPVVGGSSC